MDAPRVRGWAERQAATASQPASQPASQAGEPRFARCRKLGAMIGVDSAERWLHVVLQAKPLPTQHCRGQRGGLSVSSLLWQAG